jgi:hypothetical protein
MLANEMGKKSENAQRAAFDPLGGDAELMPMATCALVWPELDLATRIPAAIVNHARQHVIT